MLRETGNHVIRIFCALEVRQMTTRTRGGCEPEICFEMTLGTRHRRVSSRQREPGC